MSYNFMFQEKIIIIGFGRFGRLLAEILAPFGEINIISRRSISAKLESILEVNKKTQTKIKQIHFKDIEKICQSGFTWIIPTVPISVTPDVLKKIAPYLRPGTLVMDVCSVKYYPCFWLRKHLPSYVELLGSHPMFGPDSAKKGLNGLQIVFCPLRISQKKYNKIKKIFSSLGLRIIEVSAHEHDKQSANSLALVHYIGRALGKMKIYDQKISTLGFRRLLQVCENVENDTRELFKDMHKFNPYAPRVRQKFLRSLQKINLMLNLDNQNDLMSWRVAIDAIDKEIFWLIEERLKLTKKIGQLKKKNNLLIIDKKREKEMITKAQRMFKKLNKEFVEKLYQLIFSESYKKQKRR